MRPTPPRSTLFPYTTLFRSVARFHVLDDTALARAVRADREQIIAAGDPRRVREPTRIGGPRRRAVDGASPPDPARGAPSDRDRKSTRLNSSHTVISYAVFCL